jgi:hypothetical protein
MGASVMFTQADLAVANDSLEQSARQVERQREIVEILAGNPEFQSLARDVLAELEAALERRRRYRDGIQTLMDAEQIAAGGLRAG